MRNNLRTVWELGSIYATRFAVVTSLFSVEITSCELIFAVTTGERK